MYVQGVGLSGLATNDVSLLQIRESNFRTLIVKTFGTHLDVDKGKGGKVFQLGDVPPPIIGAQFVKMEENDEPVHALLLGKH